MTILDRVSEELDRNELPYADDLDAEFDRLIVGRDERRWECRTATSGRAVAHAIDSMADMTSKVPRRRVAKPGYRRIQLLCTSETTMLLARLRVNEPKRSAVRKLFTKPADPDTFMAATELSDGDFDEDRRTVTEAFDGAFLTGRPTFKDVKRAYTYWGPGEAQTPTMLAVREVTATSKGWLASLVERAGTDGVVALQGLAESGKISHTERQRQENRQAALEHREPRPDLLKDPAGVQSTLIDTSIVIAVNGPVDDSRPICNSPHFEIAPLHKHQDQAIMETWPASTVQASPHLHDVPVGAIGRGFLCR